MKHPFSIISSSKLEHLAHVNVPFILLKEFFRMTSVLRLWTSWKETDLTFWKQFSPIHRYSNILPLGMENFSIVLLFIELAAMTNAFMFCNWFWMVAGVGANTNDGRLSCFPAVSMIWYSPASRNKRKNSHRLISLPCSMFVFYELLSFLTLEFMLHCEKGRAV